MDFILHNLRLRELVAIVKENRSLYQDFAGFLGQEGYNSVLEFIEEFQSELYIYIQANPNQVAAIEPILAQKMTDELLPLLENISGG